MPGSPYCLAVEPRPILESSWPSDLDPATVPFKARTVTVLRRQGFSDDWTRFKGLTASRVLA